MVVWNSILGLVGNAEGDGQLYDHSAEHSDQCVASWLELGCDLTWLLNLSQLCSCVEFREFVTAAINNAVGFESVSDCCLTSVYVQSWNESFHGEPDHDEDLTTDNYLGCVDCLDAEHDEACSADCSQNENRE